MAKDLRKVKKDTYKQLEKSNEENVDRITIGIILIGILCAIVEQLLRNNWI